MSGRGPVAGLEPRRVQDENGHELGPCGLAC